LNQYHHKRPVSFIDDAPVNGVLSHLVEGCLDCICSVACLEGSIQR
jgi:hypothetical protein